MKRRDSSLYALAVATGAGLLFAVPAMAGTAYTTYTNDFVTPGAGPLLNVFNNPADADYNYTAISGNVFNLAAGKTVSAGGYSDAISGTTYASVPDSTAPANQPTIPNHVEGGAGDKAANVTWQVSTAGPSTIGYTGDKNTHSYIASTTNAYPTVDLGGTVSFDFYVSSFDSNIAPINSGTVLVELEVNGSNSTVSATDTAALGKSAKSGTDTSDLFMVGAAPSNGASGGTTTPDGTPAGGKALNLGVAGWQHVTFNLAGDPHTPVSGASTYGPGLGDLYGIYFTPVNAAAGQVYSVNIDNLVIAPAAAPEPSAWLGLAAGGAMLLGLGLVSARRRRGVNAA